MDTLDWDDLYPRILKAAYRMTWNHPNRNEQAEALAHEAIVRSFSTRTLDLSRYEYFVYAVKIMQSIRGEEFRPAKSDLRQPKSKRFVNDDAIVVRLRDLRPTPEDEVVDQSSKAQILRYIARRNINACIVAALLLKDFKTSPEIAKIMGCTPSQVDYFKQQLRTIATDIINNEPEYAESPARRLLSQLSVTKE